MADLENYWGLSVLVSASQPGGEAISENFRRTVEWHPRSVWDKTSDPTANDDGTNDAAKNYQVGSFWYNTSSKKLFICTDNTVTHAKWQLMPYLLLQTSDGVIDPKLSSSIDANGFQIFNGSFSGNGGLLTSVIADSVLTQTASAIGNSVVFRNSSADFNAHQINVTNLVASGSVQVTSPGTFTGSGANITSLSAANISAGTLATARGGTGLTGFLGANRLLVSSSASALSLLGATANRVLVTDGSSNISWGNTLPSVSGANLTSLTAANVTGSNTLPDGVLSTNVPLKNAANTFTSAQTLPSNGLTVGSTQLVVSSGNVGVGTSSPSATLHVAGDTIIDNNLGIGMTPYNRIDVDGGAYCDGESWVPVSSVTRKERFEAVDPRDVLGLVEQLAVCAWSYIGKNARHIGPVSEDFHRLFKVGNDDKSLSPTDSSGVALACIKALLERVKRLEEMLIAKNAET